MLYLFYDKNSRKAENKTKAKKAKGSKHTRTDKILVMPWLRLQGHRFQAAAEQEMHTPIFRCLHEQNNFLFSFLLRMQWSYNSMFCFPLVPLPECQSILI